MNSSTCIQVTGVPPKAPLGSVTVTTNNELHQNPEDLYEADLNQQDLYDAALEHRAEDLVKQSFLSGARPSRPYWNTRQSRDLYRRDFDEEVKK